MATIIATVKNLEGKFFAKDTDGNIVELKNGDVITQDMLIFGDKSNSASASIEMAMADGSENVILTGTQEQAFDSSLTDGPNQEDGLAQDSLQKTLDENLYADSDDTDKENEDEAVLDDTAAGEEKAKQNEGGEGQFEERNGEQTDIVAGLRDAEFGLAGAQEKYDGEPQKVILNAELSIDGMTLVREGDSAEYTLTVTNAPISDLIVRVKIAHIDTDSGDIVTETISVTIPAGTTTGTFTINNFDSLLAEDDEDYSVTIVGTEGGGYDNLTIGKDSVTTTIIDETSNENPDPEDIVTLRLVALDANDEIITDANGDYVMANEVAEGSAASYMAVLVDPEGNIVTDAQGSVVVEYTQGSATSGVDYDGTPTQTVTLNQVIDKDTLDDYIADSGETFTIEIQDNSYTNTADYENVIYNLDAVTTTIIDDTGTPNTLPPVDTDPETDHEIVQIKLVAADSNGDAIVVNGNYVLAESVQEGASGYYIALAFEPNTTPSPTTLIASNGTVDVSFSNNDATGASSQSAIDGSQDYDNDGQTVTIGQAFNTATFDDYLAEGEHTFNVSIDTGSYTPPTPTTGYENVTIDTTPVVTTITDGNVGDETPNEATDTVYATIIGPSDVNEGDTTTDYTVQLLDKDGNPVVVTADTVVTVRYTNISTEDGDTVYDNNDTISVTISANGSTGTFRVATQDDYMADNNEDYNLEITDVATTEFERVDTDGFTDTTGTTHANSVITTIHDDTGTPDTPNDGVETDHEIVQIKLVAADSNGDAIVVNGNYVLAESVQEGASGYYIALAFEPNTTPSPTTLIASNGTVDVSFSNNDATGASSQSAIDGSQDYDNDGQTVTIGQAFNTATFDDYLAEGEHTFNVSIDTGSYTPPTPTTGYENMTIDTTPVVTTITDGNSGDETPNQNVDTVYTVITGVATVAEGNDATYTVKLVDKDGNNVNVTQDTTVTLTFNHIDAENGDYQYNDGATLDVIILPQGNGNTGYSVDLDVSTIDDFIAEYGLNGDLENYSVTITTVNDQGQFENVVIGDINGANSSVTTEITDDLSLGTPLDSAVQEDDIVDGSRDSDSNSLGITASATANYTIEFENTDTPYPSVTTDGGIAVNYTLTNPTTLTATNSATGEVVFVVTLNKATGEHEFVLHQNIDHDDTVDGAKEIEQLTFGFKVTDTDSGTSATRAFNVDVEDSLPDADGVAITVDEDNSQTIVLSSDAFRDGEVELDTTGSGNSYETLASGAQTTVYASNDNTNPVGTVTNNGDGTLTFVPTSDYSGDVNSIMYRVTDSDGDSAENSISITVNPIADTATITSSNITINEDDSNTQEGIYAADLGLTLPALSKDQTDISSTEVGDHAERLGYITLTLSRSDAQLVKDDGTVIIDDSSTTVKIYITDLAENYHHSDLNPAADGAVSMTKAEYENLQIIHAEDNSTNIRLNIEVTSYEVDDSNVPLNVNDSDLYQTTSSNMYITINATTDDISLRFNDDQGLGSVSDVNGTDDHFTFNSIEEGSPARVIDLQSILSDTSGYENDLTPKGGDLDGSEKRSYTVEGIPEGSIINLGGVTAVADATGSATVEFSNTSNQDQDPSFTLTLPQEFGGDISGAKITLSVTDTNSVTKTAEVTFDIDVDQVADQVTLNVSQAIGFEDAGRTEGNTSNIEADAQNIDDIAGAIDLDINVTSDDKDGSESYTVIISDIPTGAVIYYNGVEVVQNANSIQIDNFNNTTPLKIVPPHNSDTDFDLRVKSYSIESNGSTSEAMTQELTMNVQVKGVADIPVNDTLNEVVASNGNTYQAIVTEDMGNTQDGATVDFRDIYANANLTSYDNDNSETLSIVVTGLSGEFNIEGATFMGGNGANRKWVFDADAVNDGTVKITTEKNYSGEINFDVKYVTTEQEGDSKTHDFEPVKILVTPDTEAVMNLQTSVVEDIASAVNFGVAIADGDTNEGIETVWINIADVSNRDFTLSLNGNDIATAGLEEENGFYKLTGNDINNVTIKYDSDLGSSNDRSFGIKYATVDSAAGIDNVSDEINATYNLTLSAVTDAIAIDATNINGNNIAVDTSSNTEVITINSTGNFTVDVALNAVASDNSDKDQDGSEAVTRLVVEGVPLGISIDGGEFTQTANGTNLWFIDIPDTQLDGSYTLTFKVNDELADGINNENTIKITAYNQDGAGSEITTATTEMIFVDNIPNGAGGTPSTVDANLTLKTYDVVEDTEFTLYDIVDITPDATRDDEAYSLSFTGLENVDVTNTNLSTYEENGQTVYVLHIGTGDIETALKSVKFLPELNFNENNDAGERVAITATLTAYVPNTRIVDVDTEVFIDADVTPVTDAITASALIDTIDEDDSYEFDINLDTVDAPNYTVIGDVTIHHSGISGVLELSNGEVVIFDASGNATIPADSLSDLKFTPTEHEAGQVILTYSATTQEYGATNQETGGGVITLNISPVADGLNLDGLAANGVEFTDATGDEFIALTTTAGSVGDATLIDGSETIQTILVDGIPDGFLVYVGSAGSQTLAQNAGDNGTGVNTWNVKVDADSTAPQIWIKAPENWSGDVTGINLITFVKDGNSVTSSTTAFNLHVDAVASSVTIDPTKTFEDAYNWTDINLNANMTDLDGSETLTLTLSAQAGSEALDSTALFGLSDGTPIDASFENGTWILTGIASDEINNIEMLYHDYNGTIDVAAKTADGTSTVDTTVTGDFELNLSATANIDLSAEDRDIEIVIDANTTGVIGGNGIDTIIVDGDLNLNFSDIHLESIEAINLESGKHDITISLDDVFDMNTSHTLDITAIRDDDDSISIDVEGWSGTSTPNQDGTHTYEYTKDGSADSITLTVDDTIDQTIM